MHPSTHQYWEDTVDATPPNAAPTNLLPAGASAGEASGAGGKGVQEQHRLSGDALPAQAPVARSEGPEGRSGSAAAGPANFGANFGAGGLFRSSSASLSGLQGVKSASCKGQTTLSKFVTVSEPTRQDFKPPRAAGPAAAGGGARASVHPAGHDVLDDKLPWWSSQRARARGAEAMGGGGADGPSASGARSHSPAAGEGGGSPRAVAAGAPARVREDVTSRNEADGEKGLSAKVGDGGRQGSAGSSSALGKRLGALGARVGGSLGTKRFKTANPFAHAPPIAGVASKFFGAAGPAKEADVAGGSGCRHARHVGDEDATRGLWTCVRTSADAGEEGERSQADVVEETMLGLAYRSDAAAAPKVREGGWREGGRGEERSVHENMVPEGVA